MVTFIGLNGIFSIFPPGKVHWTPWNLFYIPTGEGSLDSMESFLYSIGEGSEIVYKNPKATIWIIHVHANVHPSQMCCIYY